MIAGHFYDNAEWVFNLSDLLLLCDTISVSISSHHDPNIESKDTMDYPLPERMLIDFLDGTRVPHIKDLKDDMSCAICHEPYLSGERPEVPIRLRCGHIVGQSCILTWAKPLDQTKHRNTCPICRQQVFNVKLEDLYSRAPTPGWGNEETSIEETSTEETSTTHEEDIEGVDRGEQSDSQSETSSSGTGAVTVIGDIEADFGEGRHFHADLQNFRRNPVARARRVIWLQFCEGVVKTVEDACDAAASLQAGAANRIVRMKDFQDLESLRSRDPHLANELYNRFSTLHYELDLRIPAAQPMSDIDVSSHLELEDYLGPEHRPWTIHIAGFASRLRQRLARIPLSARYDLMSEEERMARNAMDDRLRIILEGPEE